jgi:hypothetical protein
LADDLLGKNAEKNSNRSHPSMLMKPRENRGVLQIQVGDTRTVVISNMGELSPAPGEDLKRQPLKERRRHLENILGDSGVLFLIVFLF